MRASVLSAMIFTALVARLAEAERTVSFDFESNEVPRGVSGIGCDVSISRSPAPAAGGDSFLRVAPSTRPTTRPVVSFAMPANSPLVDSDHLLISLRAPKSPARFRWLALTADGRALFQRRFVIPPSNDWTRLDQPLLGLRWDDRRVGSWSEVREIALRLESNADSQFDLDEFAVNTTPDDRSAWLLKIAFAGREVVSVRRGGVLVATDAVEGMAQADVERIAAEMLHVRAFVARIFGDVVRPTDDLGPASLLILANAKDDESFFQRLGESWGAEIPPSHSQGYTIQDVATSTFDPKLGARRPVYIHEASHAIVARDLRLLTGRASHSVIQEGVANFVQVCWFPESVDPKVYQINFSKPVESNRTSFFVPMETLFSERATPRRYAQLASVIAYLIDDDRNLLRELARCLADDRGVDAALRSRGLTWNELERRWYAWGNQRFVRDAPHPTPFDVPAEFEGGGVPKP